MLSMIWGIDLDWIIIAVLGVILFCRAQWRR
jgi:hypothetical protein